MAQVEGSYLWKGVSVDMMSRQELVEALKQYIRKMVEDYEFLCSRGLM